MMNYILCLTGMTFQNHFSQQQGICGLVVFTLWHSISQHRHNKYFKCSTEETYSMFVKRIAGILKKEQVVYRCMAK